MKKYLFSLLISFGLVFFSSCFGGSATFTGHVDGVGNNSEIAIFNIPNKYPSCDISIYCEFNNLTSNYFFYRNVLSWQHTNFGQSTSLKYYSASTIQPASNSFTFVPSSSDFSPTCYDLFFFYIQGQGNKDISFDWSCVVSGDSILDSSVSCPACPECPICPSQYTSEECQSEYGLITTGSVNQEFCLDNNLCPVNTGSWSNIFVNDIRFQSMPFIYLTIPEEIDWDYQLTDFSLDIDIGGYNTDSEYIENIINTQRSKPTEEDLSNLFFGVFPLLFPGFIFILFLYFAFKLIKKIF